VGAGLRLIGHAGCSFRVGEGWFSRVTGFSGATYVDVRPEIFGSAPSPGGLLDALLTPTFNTQRKALATELMRFGSGIEALNCAPTRPGRPDYLQRE